MFNHKYDFIFTIVMLYSLPTVLQLALFHPILNMKKLQEIMCSKELFLSVHRGLLYNFSCLHSVS